MKIFYLFILEVIFCSANHDLAARKQIWHWWNSKASVMKPMNCKLSHENTENIPENVRKFLPKSKPRVIVNSRPCRDEEQKTPYYFKGEIVNDKFEGPGKLKLNSAKHLQNHQDYNVCIDLQKGNSVVEIVGNFQNGTLHGHGKFVTDKGLKVICEFENGRMKGFQRYFDTNGTLTTVVDRHGNSEEAWLFGQNEKHLLYKPISTGYFQSSDQVQQFIVIPEDETEDILIGNAHEGFLQFLSEVHSVDLQLITDEYCTPKIKWKIKEKQNFDFQLNGKKLYHYQERNTFCKGLNGVNAEEQYMSTLGEFQSFELHEDILPMLYKIKPESSPIQEHEIKKKFLTNMTVFFDDKTVKVNASVWNGPQSTWRTKLNYFGLNQEVKLQGLNHLSIEEKFRSKSGSFDFLNWTPTEITGIFKNGTLQGITIIRTDRNQFLVATFKDGVLHGPAYVFGTISILDLEARGFERTNLNPSIGTGFYGRFKNGQVDGNFWINMIGNGWVHGKPNHEGLITGPEIAYIYPDGVTAFKGDFKNRFMKKAYNVDVIKYGCDEYGMVKVEQFTPPLSDQVFSYDPCTNDSFGGGSKFIEDPYELKTVALGPSSIPNSGEGVILKRDVPRDRIVCMYSLHCYTFQQYEFFMENHSMNTSKTDDYRRACEKYAVPFISYNGIISLPPELDVNPLPNLGPKVNHHFTSNNSYYQEMEHPRWGYINAVKTSVDLKAGNELFTYYAYERTGAQEFPNDHLWYFEAKAALDKEVKKEKKKGSRKKKHKK